MARDPDWKPFMALVPIAVERFHQITLDATQIVLDNTTLSARSRYFTLRKLMQERHKDLRSAFDNLGPSTAWLSLRLMVMYDVVTEEELSRFTPDMLESLKGVVRQKYEIPWLEENES